jgi:hypothetical protein
MSRDPKDGYIDEPASLHKYLYANGDPVNGIDPTGRGSDLTDEAIINWEAVVDTVVYAYRTKGFVNCVSAELSFLFAMLNKNPIAVSAGFLNGANQAAQCLVIFEGF